MISIIIPIYKVEKYIRECIESVINQTYKDLEIILVDDGSPDNCPEICDEYANMDKRIKVIHKENGGLMSARQAGLRAATGDYIGFVDGDDWIESNMYEHFASAIEKYHPDIAICEFYFAYPERNELSSQHLTKSFFEKCDVEREIYPTMLFKDVFFRTGINPCCWSKVFKKEILENCLFKVTPKIRIGEDAAFTYPCLLESESVAYIDKYLYHYRINSQSMTNAYDMNLEDTILIPYEILKKTFSNYSFDFSNQINYYLIFLVNFVIRNEAHPDNNKSVIEKIKTLKKFASNKDVINAAKSIDYSVLPMHTKFIAKSLSIRSSALLYLYSVILRRIFKWRIR